LNFHSSFFIGLRIYHRCEGSATFSHGSLLNAMRTEGRSKISTGTADLTAVTWAGVRPLKIVRTCVQCWRKTQQMPSYFNDRSYGAGTGLLNVGARSRCMVGG